MHLPRWRDRQGLKSLGRKGFDPVLGEMGDKHLEPILTYNPFSPENEENGSRHKLPLVPGP